jgi:hypothetical protein
VSVVLQAADPGNHGRIYNLPCDSIAEAQRAAKHLLTTGRPLGLLRIQVAGATVKEWIVA